MFTTIKGIVVTNANTIPDGVFHAIFEEISDIPQRCFMTSPYFRLNGGGMMAVPEDGDQILALLDGDTGEIYYQSTIVGISPDSLEGGIKDFSLLPESSYNKGGKPVKVTYQNAVGDGLEITRNYDPTPNEKVVHSVALKSKKGKRISLDDSPDIEAVIVRNQHGDGMTIRGDETDAFAERTIDVKSNGSQNYTCFEGQLELRVVNGRDIIIENNSTGSMSQTPSPEFWPNPGDPPKRFGGIYLRSENGDVSISTQADEGKLFLVTPNARIQIDDKGNVQISANSLEINSAGDISMKAGGDIKMEGANVDINSSGVANLFGTNELNIASISSNTNIDGLAVNLNSKLAIPSKPEPLELTEPKLNDYNE